MRAAPLLAVPALVLLTAGVAASSARLAPDSADTGSDTGEIADTEESADTADSGPWVGAAGLAGETGGCGCSTSAVRSSPPILGLLVLALALRRRR